MDWPVEISARAPLNSSAPPPAPSIALRPLLRALGACGAWVLRREQAWNSEATLVFEFPRDVSAEVYGVLVSNGLQLNDRSHRILTDLCRCTPDLFDRPSRALAVYDAASLARATEYVCTLEIIQAVLRICWATQGTMDQAFRATWN